LSPDLNEKKRRGVLSIVSAAPEGRPGGGSK